VVAPLFLCRLALRLLLPLLPVLLLLGLIVDDRIAH
jgi:hypothetical protein